MPDLPRITFGIIVLNGEPFVRYCLRALYPFAHEIIVVEGAAPGASNIATPDGHSRDSTLETVRQFMAEEDPARKVQLIVRDGFWSEKDEMSQAYAARATGDYLWQVDIDEFYQPQDMQAVLGMLAADPTITAMSFKQIQFWGGLGAWVDSWFLRRGAEVFHRLFRWGPGYQYATHRPPTVLTDTGRDTRSLHWIDAQQTMRHGIYLYHYSLVFPKQVQEKCDYYGHAEWAQRAQAQRWADEVFLRLRRPFRAHNVYDYPGWLERYTGDHPPQIRALFDDIVQGRLAVDLRRTDDIERLLASPWYATGKIALKALDPVDRVLRPPLRVVKRLVTDPVGSTRAVQRRIRQRAARAAQRSRVVVRCRTEFHGSPYGGWTLCPDGLDCDSVVYSFGVGEDITFDRSLIARFGVTVHAFDPTPRAVAWVRRQVVPASFVFHPYGVADYDGVAQFFAPDDPAHVSRSMVYGARGAETAEGEVHRLETILRMLGHTRIDLLKLDIEGAEYAVLEDLIRSGVDVGQLLVEFHHRRPEIGATRTEEAIRRLREVGLRLFHISDNGQNYAFIHRPGSYRCTS